MPDVTAIRPFSTPGSSLATIPGEASPATPRKFSDILQSLEEVKPVRETDPDKDPADDPAAGEATDESAESKEPIEASQIDNAHAPGGETAMAESELAAKKDPALIDNADFERPAPLAFDQVDFDPLDALPVQSAAGIEDNTGVTLPAPESRPTASLPGPLAVSGQASAIQQQAMSVHPGVAPTAEVQARQIRTQVTGFGMSQPANQLAASMTRTEPASIGAMQPPPDSGLMDRDKSRAAQVNSRLPAATATTPLATQHSPSGDPPAGNVPIAPAQVGDKMSEAARAILHPPVPMPTGSHGSVPVPPEALAGGPYLNSTSSPRAMDPGTAASNGAMGAAMMRAPKVDHGQATVPAAGESAMPRSELPSQSQAAMTTPATFLSTRDPVPVEASPATTREGSADPAISGLSDIDMRINQADRSATPQSARVPELAREIARQLAPSISVAADGQIEIGLSPKELGNVRMTLNVGESSLTLTINAERWETADLMRRYASGLSEAFKDLGYESIAFSFGGGSDPGASGEAPADSPEADETTVVDPSQDSATPSRSTVSASLAGGLDLRI